MYNTRLNQKQAITRREWATAAQDRLNYMSGILWQRVQLCTTSCFDAFHVACLNTWLQQPPRCPICGRSHISTQPLFASGTDRNQFNEAGEIVVPSAEAAELRERAEQAEQVEAGRTALEEQQATFEQQHILQVRGLLFDVEHWQGSFERSEETIQGMRARIRTLEATERSYRRAGRARYER